MDKTFQHIEFDPFVLPRIHRPALELNSKVNEQYKEFLRYLTWKLQEIDENDILEGVYYLLLQERLSEAKELFYQITPSPKWNDNVHYQYMKAYLLYYELVDSSHSMNAEIFHQIYSIGLQFIDFPVTVWSNRFTILLQQLRELGEFYDISEFDLDSHSLPNCTIDTIEKEKDSYFNVVVTPDADRNIRISYKNLAGESNKCVVSLYRIDMEVLFSTNPFGSEEITRGSFIHPNHRVEFELQGVEGETSLLMPSDFKGDDVIVETSTDGLFRSITSYSNSLTVNRKFSMYTRSDTDQ